MLREPFQSDMPWSERTASALRTRQLRASEARTEALAPLSLFGQCSDAQAELLWRSSFDALEHPLDKRLHSIAEMRSRLMVDLPAEAGLISPYEHHLVEKLIASGGKIALNDWNELDTAECLVRRLWCTMTAQDESEPGKPRMLHMPPELCGTLMLILTSKPHCDLREALYNTDLPIHTLLYHYGAIPASIALSMLRKSMGEETHADDENLIVRYLRITYDCCYDAHGRLILLHPALADPSLVMAHLPETANVSQLEQVETLTYGELLPSEKPAFLQMVNELRGAALPECTEDEAALNLLALCKQGISYNDACEVLSGLLMVMPNRNMLSALRYLHASAIRWGTQHTGVLQ